MTPRIFLSYSRKDGAAAAELLSALRDQGFVVWMDQSSIPPSVPWMEEITNAIRGASLVVVLDTEHWHASPNCAVESTVAFDFDVPRVHVSPEQPLQERLDAVVRRLNALPPTIVDEADLLGASHRWVLSGRRTSHLPTGRRLRELERLQAMDSPRMQDVITVDYVKAAHRRRRRRRTLTVVATLVTGVLLLVPGTMRRTTDEVNRRLAAIQADRSAEQAVRAAAAYDPPEALDKAVTLAKQGGDTYLNRRALVEAISIRLPESVTPSGSAPAHAPDPAITIDPNTGRVAVHSAATLVWGAVISGATDAAIDAARTRIAVLTPAEIRIVDLRTGAEVARLRGAPHLSRLAWLETAGQPDRVRGWASNGEAVTWQVDNAVLVSHDASRWFMDTAVSSDGTVAAVTRDGAVWEIDGNGSVRRLDNAPGGIGISISPSPMGWLVGTTDRTGRLTLVATNGETHTVNLPDCMPLDSVWSQKRQSVYVACGSSDVYRVRLPQLTATKVRTDLLESATLADAGDTVLVGGGPMEFEQLDSNDKASVYAYGTAICWGGARKAVYDTTSGTLVAAGRGAAGLCPALWHETADGRQRHVIFPPFDYGDEVRGLALHPQQPWLAVGGSNGTILVLRLSDQAPLQVSHATGSEIHGLEFTPDGKTIVAVTRNGDVIRLPLTLASEDIAHLRQQASSIALAQRTLSAAD